MVEVPVNRTHYAPSPTLERLHASDALFRGIRGPIGSGKSVGCVADLLMWMIEQEPDARGVRRTRFAVVRGTYGELRTTTIATFKEWMPAEACHWKMDQPINCMVRFNCDDDDGNPDGTMVESEFWFISMDSERDLKKLKSLELTGAWLNEASELPWSVVEMARGRVGRFPGKKFGAPITRYGVLADTNPPDDDHWWYKLAEQERPEGFEFFRQPAAILWDGVSWQPNPEAENVKHQQLGYSYWLNQVPGATVEFVRTMLCGEYGGIQDGRPVYPQYNDQIHCASEILRPDPLITTIHLGWDWGTMPACVVTQLTPMGQLRILDEIYTDDGVVRDLAANRVRPLLAQDYAGMTIKGWGDPAGVARESSGLTAFEVLREEQLPAIEAPSNAIGMRLDAVAYFLGRMVEGNPGFLLSPHCERLRKGFRGRYKYEKIITRLGKDERYQSSPAKNKFSHCFVAGTMVATPDGERAIESLRVGDLVVTPYGNRAVVAVMSRDAEALVELSFSNGRSVQCTADHPFLTSRGRVRADELQYNDVLQSIGGTQWAGQQNIASKSSTVSATTGSHQAITGRMARALAICTETFGDFITGRYRQTITFTTATGTVATMTLPILSACTAAHTFRSTHARTPSPGQTKQSGTWLTFVRPRLHGTPRQKGSHGIVSTQPRYGLTARLSGALACAVREFTRYCVARLSVAFARRLANRQQDAQSASMTRNVPAPSVGARSWSTDTRAEKPVARLVGRNTCAGAMVYDLTVEDAHCFYAAGVLVSNCHDALQYVALGLRGAAKSSGARPTTRLRRKSSWVSA